MSNIFWAGDEESYEVVLKAQASVQAMAKAILAGEIGQPELPKSWTKDGTLAIVPVRGSLIMGQAGWMSMFGCTGYDDITSAMTEAALDPDVKSILLDVGSGGGAANGAQPTADYLSQIKAIKPISAHIDPVGGSAAYWVASIADNISVDAMGLAGSIGAVMIHTSISKMLADQGIEKTVIRSGEFKMIGNPYEPLSDAAKADMQSQVNDVNSQFEAHVAKMRGVDKSEVGAQMGQGRTFLGKRAVTAGLVDKVQTRDQAIAAAKNR